MENTYIAEFYTNNDEDPRLASRHGSVEFLTTMRYIDKYLREGDRVIEIGAATGRYSHALARRGYEVDAVELVERNIEVFRANTRPGERVTVTQGNALDLSGFADGTYDITLLLGPLYHLYNAEDKRRAISEALRVTKPGGVVFAAYIISDGVILDEGFKRNNAEITRRFSAGLIDPVTFAARSGGEEDIFELVRKEDIDGLMKGFPAERLHYVATDGYAGHMSKAVDAMDEDTFDLYMRYHFATCERADMAGMSHHVIDVFRKAAVGGRF